MRASAVDDETLLAAAEGARHLRELLQSLGLAAYGGNYESVRKRLARLGRLEERFQPRAGQATRLLQDVPPERLQAAVFASSSLHAVLRSLAVPASSSTYAVLRARLLAEGIDTSGLTGRATRPGLTARPRRPITDLLVLGGTTDVGHLKARLVREGLLTLVCAGCGIESWRGQPAPLELDHGNGDRSDNRRENLRLLCPNCHAQTPTFRGRNKGRRPRTLPGAARVV